MIVILVLFLMALLAVALYMIADRAAGGRENTWVDETRQVPLGPGQPELINFTDNRSVTRHKVDVNYDPRAGADEQDSAEIDTRKRERIQAVIAQSMTLEAKMPTPPGTAPTRPMPWPAPEHQRNADIDEERKTRLRQLLRDTQSPS